MEKIKIVLLENSNKSANEMMADWPANNEAAEKLFVQILADMGEKLEFTKRSPWFVDKHGEMVWWLCERKSKVPVMKMERVARPPSTEQNIVLGSGPDKYTYFVCYRRNGVYTNDVVVLDHPVLTISDIRAIEWGLVDKNSSWSPTIVNISLLDGPAKPQINILYNLDNFE